MHKNFYLLICLLTVLTITCSCTKNEADQETTIQIQNDRPRTTDIYDATRDGSIYELAVSYYDANSVKRDSLYIPSVVCEGYISKKYKPEANITKVKVSFLLVSPISKYYTVHNLRQSVNGYFILKPGQNNIIKINKESVLTEATSY